MALPDASFWIMYGPVATWCSPYVLGFFLSNGAAYCLGTGEVSIIPRAPPASTPPLALLKWKTIVLLSGVVMPLLSVVPGFASTLAPMMSPKEAPAWPLATVLKKPRSTAYLTSLDVTSRLTGAENFTPLRILT